MYKRQHHAVPVRNGDGRARRFVEHLRIACGKGRKLSLIHICHGLDGLLDELYTVADCGCGVLDVTVEHPVYGQLSGQLQVFSRYDADVFWDALQKNGAQPLCRCV